MTLKAFNCEDLVYVKLTDKIKAPGIVSEVSKQKIKVLFTYGGASAEQWFMPRNIKLRRVK